MTEVREKPVQRSCRNSFKRMNTKNERSCTNIVNIISDIIVVTVCKYAYIRYSVGLCQRLIYRIQ